MNNSSRDGTNLAQDYWEKHSQRLLARRRMHANVDKADLVNTVFIKLAKVSNDRWETMEKKDNYLQTVFTSALSDALTANGKQESIEVVENWADKVGRNPNDAYIAAILIKQLTEMCSAEEKDLLEHMFQSPTGKEVAEGLDISESAARKRIQRLRAKLQLLLKGGNKLPAKD